ncbi:MAG: long-chain-fatty-acid--CoA ligase [Elusimicrobiota bacterium]
MINDKNIRTLNDLVDSAARHRGRHPSIVTLEESLSYQELRQQILHAAAGMHAAGIKRGDCVAIVHRNGTPFIASYFALARLGAIAVPINFMVQKPDDLAYMLNDCRAIAAVTQEEFLPGLRRALRQTPNIRRIWISDPGENSRPRANSHHHHGALETPFAELLKHDPHRLPHVSVSEHDTVAILYASGTTGVPKGVMLSHRNLVTNCTAALNHVHIRQSDVVLCILPMFHTFAWTANVLGPMRMGIKFAVSPSVTPAKPWLKLMARHGVTLFTGIPQLLTVLAKEAVGVKRVFLRWWFFRRVRLVISGAAPLRPEAQKHFEAAMGIPVLEGYGLTETSPVAAINPPGRRKLGTVGTPIPGVRIKTIDEQGRDLPQGADGEICISGECVMQGYYKRPEDTGAAFTPDGWFKTGDIGCIDREGYLAIKDRKKDMIIIKGLKVFSAQVESAIMEYPAVAEAAVIGVPHDDGSETVKAFVVLRKGAHADRAELLRFCRQKLDGYKRPRDIEIVDNLPKNSLQKVLKNVLRTLEVERRRQGAAG